MRKVLLLLLLPLLVAGCGERVDPGYVGIKVNLYGGAKGVADLPLRTGMVWYNPFTERVYVYPTFMQNVVWTRDPHEGPENVAEGTDQSMTLSSIEGTTINCDVGVNYQFVPDKVPALFAEFRQTPENITANYLRTQVRNHLMVETTKMKVMDVMGAGQARLFETVLNDLNRDLGPRGFKFDMVTFVNKPRPSGDVESAINAAIAATQRAIEAENKIRQAHAEAEQRAAQAKGFADSILTVAQAQADANRKLSASITPTLIQYQATKQWDGVLPTFTGGGAIPFVEVPKR